MKIEIQNAKFVPIVITLETEKEARALKDYFGCLSLYNMRKTMEHKEESDPKLANKLTSGIYSKLSRVLQEES